MKLNIAPGAILAVIVLLVIVNGLLLIPATAGHIVPIAGLSLVLALIVLIYSLTAGRNIAPAQPVQTVTSAPVPAPIQPPAPTARQAEAEIVTFFGLLQEKGRLVDFLMEDITPYEDSEVGAAARVIHQGCRQVLQEYFNISPISEAAEGSEITLPAGYSADQFRLVGKISGEPPFTGTLLHKGWKTEYVKLPRIVNADRLPAIAPAEVELK
jgi:Domain of unknown function (DUF2760)